MNKEHIKLTTKNSEMIGKNVDNLFRLSLIVEDLQKMISVMSSTNAMMVLIITKLMERIEKLEMKK